MFVRRRPLLRAAVVGGGAYVAGKKMAQHPAGRAAPEASQDEGISQREAQRQDQQQQERGTSVADQLRQLSALHDQGALTDEEFAAAKSRLLTA